MNYHEVLGINKDATPEEVRKAYLRMALLNHPDRHQENKEHYEEKFKKIGEAYEMLYKNKNNSKIKTDPYDIFKNLFPKNININKDTINIISDIYQKIIDNDYNFNLTLFFDMITLVNQPNFKKKINDYFDSSLTIKLKETKAKTLIIDRVIDLNTQYNSNNYTIDIELQKRSKSRFPKLIKYVKQFNINLLDEKIILTEQGNYNLTDKYQGDLEINIIDEPHIHFKRYKDFDLSYTVCISNEDFLTKIYHVIDHFKHPIHIQIDSPYRHFVYLLKNYGMVDYSDNYFGDLYIIIKVDPSICDTDPDYRTRFPRHLDNCKIPEYIDIFN